tara:strand:+ start:684 stop:1028 length:345 start_codon:yes stop_codon:yes gene_type:complete
MEWFQNKTTQIIALVTIIGTLAGFGYTGATYVNRLENLERKIDTVSETEDAQQDIEERFAAIESFVTYTNKTLDEDIKVSKAQAESISLLKAQVEGLSVAVRTLEEDNKNPLAN